MATDTQGGRNDVKEPDQRLRDRVDKLIAQSPSKSTGSIHLGGQQMDYSVCAEFVPVVAEGFEGAVGEAQAAVMTTSYVLTGPDAGSRSVCFAFNGGPGSASVWLHLGALGPKRVVSPDDGSMARGPYAVVDNPHSWFEQFDLVFIDPPHTGWSICASAEARKKMFSVDGDVAAIADVMRTWLTRHKRWGSAIYLAGESYGTLRCAALADKLQSTGLALQGLILISSAMDLQSVDFAPGNDLPYSLFLPAFANASQHHGLLKGALAKSPAAARAAAESFVDEDYVAALQSGARLDGKRRTRISKRIAELTGLPQALVEEKNLRISDGTYFVEALRQQGRVVGRLDARCTATQASSRTSEMEFDPSIEAVVPVYTMAAMSYFTDQLGMQTEQPYEVVSYAVNAAWDWHRGDEKGSGFASTSRDLARALRRNPHLRVFVASGRFDLGSTYSATDWSLAQLDVQQAVFGRVQHFYYDAGHMMYTQQASLAQLKTDLQSWIDG